MAVRRCRIWLIMGDKYGNEDDDANEDDNDNVEEEKNIDES